MSDRMRTKLASISTLEALIELLRNELGWPIEVDSFDDLVFEYDPEDLGLDPGVVAKIETIRRMRPLVPHQPWGIFFVEFDRKRLPVIPLRRILNAVVTKKRANASQAERPTWDMDDLMFVSAFGEADTRQIGIAHFSRNPERALPDIKVLGWDDRDTPLHLDAVAEALTKKLAWPDDVEDTDSWKETWRSAFTLRHREVITTSRDLALRLARLAASIRARILAALDVEADSGPLSALMSAFREALVHDLDEDSFADMYAQTISYGLLTARITSPGHSAGATRVRLAASNPFLRELMEELLALGSDDPSAVHYRLDFDELGVGDVVDLLDDADIDAVLRDFGDRNPDEDPVIHFYEGFLSQYDPGMRMERGVFYTPRPVVSFIVRSVHDLLREELDLADGLADVSTWGEVAARTEGLEIPPGAAPDDPIVQILDPAAGTGTFLVEVIEVIHETLVARWIAEGRTSDERRELWNAYVPRDLLPRLHGYELLMAPYSVAHLKVSLKLLESGYHFEAEERAHIYLTNSLEPAHDVSDHFEFAIPALAHEAEAVNRIKRERRFTVILGNPPYSGVSSNMNDWIDGLLKGRLPGKSATTNYYEVDGGPLGEKKVWLQDDYVKFFRLGQHLIDMAGLGIIAFISNNGYVDNPTFRGMRQSLLEGNNVVRIINLHGDARKKERSPDGTKDENVFDIGQGVAIGFLGQAPNPERQVREYIDLWGTRVAKYAALTDRTLIGLMSSLEPVGPYYYLIPTSDEEVRGEYEPWVSLSSMMRVRSSGVITARDHIVIDFETKPIHDRIQKLRDTTISDRELRETLFAGKGSAKYAAGDSRGWKLPEARAALRADTAWQERIEQCAYRPLDFRKIYMADWMVDWSRQEVRRHLSIDENLVLIFPRNTGVGKPWDHVFVSRVPILGRFFPDSACISYMAPVLVSSEEDLLSSARAIRANFSVSIGGVSDPSDPAEAWRQLGYVYSVLHSSTYRDRYKSLLRGDFPRIPRARDRKLFTRLSTLGMELVQFHLLEHDRLSARDSEVFVIGNGPMTVECLSREGEVVWIDRDKTQGFGGISEGVWRYQVGGHRICQQWLEARLPKGGRHPRPGRTLSEEEVRHFQNAAVALREAIRLCASIDEVIEEHGGWPDAFQGAEAPA